MLLPFFASFDSPIALSLTASIIALLYFFLMTVSPNLPPALVFSTVIGYFVYSMKTNGNNNRIQSISLPKISAQAVLDKRA